MERKYYNIIKVGDEEAAQLGNLDIVAFQYAVPGAMGGHGGVYFVTEKKKVYHTCYLPPSPYTGYSRHMSWENLERVFPPLTDFYDWLTVDGGKVPNGWKYESLGFGNHLLVKETLWDQFYARVEQLLKDNPDEILYNLWMQAIMDVL